MAVYNQTLVTPDALYNQTKSYDARSDRKWFADIASAGVVGATDFAVTYSGVLLQLSVAAGAAWILGGNISDQGMYRQYVATATTVTCPAANGSNPRIDTVIMRVMDNTSDASGFNESRVEVVPGTATVGATLTNLSGKDPLTSLGEASKSFIVLAYILVPAAATSLTNTATNVLDARNRVRIGGGSALNIPKITTSLFSSGPPVSPVDGDIWIATAPDTGVLSTTDGTRWMFQYNASSASTYKWECIGGTPIEKFSTTADAGTAGAWVQDARTQVAGLRAGDYQTRYWAILNNTSGSASNDIEIGTGPTSGASPVGIGAFDIGATALPAAERRVIYVESPTNTLAAGSTITGFWYGGLVAVAINSRNLMVMPKRIA